MKLKLFVLLTLFSTLGVAKGPSIKFGSFSEEELTMTHYAADSSASAVILYDKGEFFDREFKFKRHVRLKVLTKAGTSWGNWTLRVPDKSNIRAVVVKRVDGQIITEKLDKSQIKEQELVSGVILYKIFLPNVTEGSLIDLEYTFSGLPYEWRFQELIPVKYSELVISEPTYVEFSTRFFGFEPIQRVANNHWLAQNVPSFKIEPFLNHYSNYLTKVQIEVSLISVPGYLYRDYSSSWESVSKMLLENNYFGGYIKESYFLNEKANELKKQNLDKKVLMDSAFKYIRENFKYNGEDDVFASSDYVFNFKKYHNGNSAEINIALISLLNKLDIVAYPVVLSTRENGLLVPFSASLNTLNYVIAMVKDGEESIFLDAAGSPVVGVLPFKCLNGNGWLIDKGYGMWVDLLNSHKMSQTKFINISYDQGKWTGKVNLKHQDYDYLSWKNKSKTFDSPDKIMASIEENNPSFLVEEYSVGQDSEQKLTGIETMILDISEWVQDTGNELYLNPFLLEENDENPFKSETRRYPVDLGHPSEYATTVILAVPEDFTVKTFPASIKAVSDDKTCSFTFLSSSDGQNVQIKYSMKIGKSVYTEEEYKSIRNFYSLVYQKLTEPILLTKN